MALGRWEIKSVSRVNESSRSGPPLSKSLVECSFTWVVAVGSSWSNAGRFSEGKTSINKDRHEVVHKKE